MTSLVIIASVNLVWEEPALYWNIHQKKYSNKTTEVGIKGKMFCPGSLIDWETLILSHNHVLLQIHFYGEESWGGYQHTELFSKVVGDK